MELIWDSVNFFKNKMETNKLALNKVLADYDCVRNLEEKEWEEAKEEDDGAEDGARGPPPAGAPGRPRHVPLPIIVRVVVVVFFFRGGKGVVGIEILPPRNLERGARFQSRLPSGSAGGGIFARPHSSQYGAAPGPAGPVEGGGAAKAAMRRRRRVRIH